MPPPNMRVQTNVHELRNWCEIQVRHVNIAIGYWLSTDVWATSWEPNAFKSATGHLHGLSARDTYFRKSFLRTTANVQILPARREIHE